MIRLVKFLVGFVLLVSFGYVLFFVPLGTLTLYQHLRNISGTDEAEALRNGIREKAEMVTTDVVDSVPELKEVDDKVDAVKKAVGAIDDKEPSQTAMTEQDAAPAAQSPAKPVNVSSDDRAALERLLKSKLN